MKKLNLAIITLLLVFQTVLSPISVFADDLGSTLPPSTEQGTNEGKDEGTTVLAKAGDSSGEIEGEDAGSNTEDGDDSTVTPSEGNEEDGGVGEKDENVETLEETTPPTYDPIMPTEVIKNVKFTVNEEEVGSKESINVTNGQSAEFEFHLELEAGHKYGPGTTLTYTLPAIFENITFPTGTAYGDVGTISKNGNDIIITFNDSLLDSFGTGVALEPNAFFMIQAEFASGNTKWDETISLIGVEDVKLNFQPKPNSGDTVSKSGTADNDGKNSKLINWTVTANTDLGVNEAAGVTNFVDTLKGAHNFKQDTVNITKLNVLPNGAFIDSSDSVLAKTTFDKDINNNDRMTIELPNEKYTAYRITYQTEVGDPGNVDKADFENNANYNGKSDSEKVTVEFGAPLAKSHEGPDESNLETTWTINYNFNNRNITSENAVLTDVWTDSQELVGTVQVFMADGKNPADITSNVSYTDIDDNPINNGFKLTFSDTVTKPYVIKYKTKPKADIYPTSDFTVTNTVKRSDMITSISNSTTYFQKELLLKKSTNGIDYDKKEMSWKILANQAGYSLAKDTVFTDTFTDNNLTLIEDTLVVKEGSNTLAKGTDYTLVNNNKNGFTITLTKATNKRIEITYDTNYDIKHIGTNEIKYRNNVQMTNSVLPNATSDSAEQKIKDEQKANGQKNGYYDYATKKFYWDVELNFNYNALTNAVFEDILPDTQEVQNIVVKKGALNASGIFEEKETLTLSNDSGKKNEIKLKLGNIQGPVKVTYESVDSDGIFPHGSPVSITNTAALTSDAGNNASWTKTVNVSHTNKILNKNGQQANSGSAIIKWDFEFNYAQSTLDNVEITDTVGKDNEGNPEQMILEDTFKVYKVALSGKTPDDPTESKIQLDPSEYTLNVDMKNGTFTLNLGKVTEAYYVEYETIFTGTSGSTVANEVEVKYLGGSQTSGNDSWSIANFKYGNQASTVKVPFVIVKTNAATGEVMKDVEFTLYSQYTGNKPLISGKTDAGGVLDFGLKLAEGQYTLKETKIDGFENPDVKFTLNRNNKATSGTFTGKQIIDIANKPESPLKCTKYELTVYDIDGNLTDKGEVTLVNKATDIAVEIPRTDGKITFTPDQVKAGQYDVIYDGKTLKTITIQYNDECGESIQPAPKCDNFTIVVEDTAGNIRTDIKELTLKSGTTEVKVSPNAAGKFILDSNKINSTDGVKPGNYTVYEGNLFLGTVNLTYAEDCGHEFIVKQAPKCESFQLTVKDVDGKLVADGTSVTVKDADKNTVETKTTTNGVIELTDLEPGEYTVEVGGEKVGSFQSNIDCEATVQPAPACKQFTLTVKDEDGNIRPNVSNIIIKDKNGAIIATDKTNEFGQIMIPSQDLPSGDYDVYQGDLYIGQITVQYSIDCEAEILAAPTCPSFTLTVQTAFGTPLANAKVTVKDAKGNVVKDADGNEILTTSVAGTIVLPNKAIQQGTYNVYEGSRFIGSFTVKDTCSALVKPALPGGGGGGSTPDPGNPEEPNKPTPDPGNPEEPNKPNPDPGNPENPNKPTPDPGNPENPNKPTPDPGNPEEPNKPTPDPGNPEEPNKPTPDPGKPVDPENPSTNPGNPSTDSKDPTAPGKPGTSKPSVQDVIEQGKNLPPYNPSTATKDKLDAYKDFLNKYNQLSQEEQANVAKTLDINKIKEDAKRLEAQLKAQGKLPQTDGATQTGLTLIGVVLVLGALFFLRRRNVEMQ